MVTYPATTTGLIAFDSNLESPPSAWLNWSVGFNNQINTFEKLASTYSKSNTYPPHNIIEVSPDHFLVEMAIAGFDPSDIEVSVKLGVLTVKGSKPSSGSDGTSTDKHYIYKGIGTRSFTREFALGEYVNVQKAAYSDGVLSIELERTLPKHLESRVIEVERKSVL